MRWAFAALAALVGAGQLVVARSGLRELRGRREVRARAVPVTADVVATQKVVLRDADGGRVTQVLTTVRFTDRDERGHTVQVALPRLVRRHRPGGTVRVVYDPQRPTTVLPVGRGGEAFATVFAGVLGGLGVALLAVAVVLALGRVPLP